MFHVKQFEILQKFADDNNIYLDEKMQEQFCCFCNFLIEENQKLNLTSIVDPKEIEIKHFIDSIYSYNTITELYGQNVSRETLDNEVYDNGLKDENQKFVSRETSDNQICFEPNNDSNQKNVSRETFPENNTCEMSANVTTKLISQESLEEQIRDKSIDEKNQINVSRETSDNQNSFEPNNDGNQKNVSRETSETFSLIDIGTGAGFPGIPLKIVFPKEKFVLVDSLNKRINFINQTIEKLNLTNIQAIAGRAEDLAKPGSEFRENFDFCVSRAVANMAVLLEYCLPFVKVGGYAVLYKSGDFKEELREAEKAIEILGGVLSEIREFTLPGSDAARSLIIIKKKTAAPDKYPRRSGKPSKSPLK